MTDRENHEESVLRALDWELPAGLEFVSRPIDELFTTIAGKVQEALTDTFAQLADGLEPSFTHYFQYLNGTSDLAIYLVPRLRAAFDIHANKPTEDKSGVLVEMPNNIQHIIDRQESEESDQFTILTDEMTIAHLLDNVTLRVFDNEGREMATWTIGRDSIELESVVPGRRRRKRRKQTPNWHVEYTSLADVEVAASYLDGLLANLAPGEIRRTDKEINSE